MTHFFRNAFVIATSVGFFSQSAQAQKFHYGLYKQLKSEEQQQLYLKSLTKKMMREAQPFFDSALKEVSLYRDRHDVKERILECGYDETSGIVTLKQKELLASTASCDIEQVTQAWDFDRSGIAGDQPAEVTCVSVNASYYPTYTELVGGAKEVRQQTYSGEFVEPCAVRAATYHFKPAGNVSPYLLMSSRRSLDTRKEKKKHNGKEFDVESWVISENGKGYDGDGQEPTKAWSGTPLEAFKLASRTLIHRSWRLAGSGPFLTRHWPISQWWQEAITPPVPREKGFRGFWRSLVE